MFCGPPVHWLHMRGRHNFCLQKSRMPLAGFVYFRIKFEHSQSMLLDCSVESSCQQTLYLGHIWIIHLVKNPHRCKIPNIEEICEKL